MATLTARDASTHCKQYLFGCCSQLLVQLASLLGAVCKTQATAVALQVGVADVVEARADDDVANGASPRIRLNRHRFECFARKQHEHVLVCLSGLQPNII